jgi:hypothetical protein
VVNIKKNGTLQFPDNHGCQLVFCRVIWYAKSGKIILIVSFEKANPMKIGGAKLRVYRSSGTRTAGLPKTNRHTWLFESALEGVFFYCRPS